MIDLQKTGGLVDNALSALEEEMTRRNLSEEEVQKVETETELEKIKLFEESPLPPNPKLWVGLLLAGLSFLSHEGSLHIMRKHCVLSERMNT